MDGDLLRADGVHLNAIGIDLWTLGIKEGSIEVWKDGRV